MKKRIMILVIVALLAIGAVSAATPSTFDFGLLNYYRISSIQDQDFGTYTPGLRLEGHILPWFGLGADVIMLAPFDGSDIYSFLVSTDLTFRANIGFFEPYLGIGPAYYATLASGDFDLINDVAYNARLGFDFNITDLFTVGVEGKLLLDGLQNEASAFEGKDWLDSTMVGLTLKAKL